MNIKDKWNNASTRTKVIIIAVLVFILLGIAGSATAGSPTPGTYDPPVIKPVDPPSIWSRNDCGQVQSWIENCDKDHAAPVKDKTPTTRPKPDPKPGPKPHPEKPGEKDPKGKPRDKPKDNASEHNGKGGNDGRGGKTRDGSKNSDKGNRK